MKTNRLHGGTLITRDTVRERAAALAMINGRRARMGGNGWVPQQTFLESVAEPERWSPIPGSAGHLALARFDNNGGGRIAGGRLVEDDRARDAGHDQMPEAAERISRGDD